jgi:tetratricopeptide (TPR) repeat protein
LKVGNALYSKTIFDAAIKHYTKALKLIGFDPSGITKSSASDDDKMDTEPVIPKDPNLAILLCNRATAYYVWYDSLSSRDFEQRQQCLKKALEDASYSIAADPKYVKVSIHISHTNTSTNTNTNTNTHFTLCSIFSWIYTIF